jgi:uncharacterized membrane protein
MATLFGITYPDPDRAKQAMESVDWANLDRLVDVKDACWISKENGELAVHPWRPVAGKAALGGALGLLVGGLFALPVIGLAAGAAIGIHKARQHVDGLDSAFVASIGEQLESGGSAIVVLFEEGADTATAATHLVRFGGTVHSTDLSPEQLARFQARLDQATLGATGAGNGPAAE